MTRRLLQPRLLITGLTAIALTALAPVARAAPKDAARPPAAAQDDTAVEEAAKARYTEGLRLFKKRKYEEARAAFLQANALKRHPAATLMLAQSALNAGRWLEAAHELDAYVAEAGELSPRLKNLVDNARRETRAHLGRIRIEAPDGAEVTIDGERVPSVEFPIEVMPGSHTIVVTHREEKKTETVDAPPGATISVKPSFVPKPLIPTEGTRSRPTPPPPPERARLDGTESTSILSPPTTTWPVYAAGAIGIGGLAAAAIFGGLQANASHAINVASETLIRNGKSPNNCAATAGWATAADQDNEAERKKYEDTCATLARNQGFARTNENLFGISLLVGLSGTVIAAGWFLFAPKDHGGKPSTDGSPAIVPWVGAGGGGATMQGRFAP